MTNRTFALGAAALTACLAGPVVAQGVSCGGLGEGAPWIGGTSLGSDIIASPGPLGVTGVSARPGGRFVTLFTVASATELRVEAQPIGGSDTLLEVYDEAGALVVVDDDSGGGLSSRAELPLAPGTYCLAVSGFGGAAVRADLQVSRLDQPAITVGLAGGFAGTEDLPLFVGVQPCLPSTRALALGSGPIDDQIAVGAVATNSVAEAPYYRFTLDTPLPLTIRAENPEADPYIYLFDGEGNLLDENDDDERSLNSRIDVRQPLDPGSYCVGVRSLSDPTEPVTLSVRGYDAIAASIDQFALADAAPSLGNDYPVTDLGPLPSVTLRDVPVPGDRAVFFSFMIQEPGMLLLSADEVNDSDPWLRFFDSDGVLIAENDDANGTLDSELSVRVQPGRYTVGVRQYSEATNGVIRLGIQRFVPAP